MLSRKTRYAIMAMSFLAKAYGRETVPMSRIADERNIPLRFLEGIFLELRHKGLLESVRGIRGGYRLARRPADISILDVILALGEDVQMVSCLDICGNSFPCEFALERDTCRIRSLFGEVHSQLHLSLLSRSLQDLI